ncbi:Ribosomal protein S9 [Spironucleus salmonicida]|uniref:Ribosomal protein S9 n=1 Tax=Spironucleus salmonicida TaxID=348837 RepID=V6LV82_9EUKA|nr:Ribosomal protein S9 [Spironucleus salmonicida]|eukprot:EST47621.1 Ribosomal protein S9 [Spironucleus salmonicida]
MPQISRLQNQRKTYSTPKRRFEKSRIMSELELAGKYGLRNKREIYRARLALAKMRSAARNLLTLDAHDQKRVIEGDALLRRLHALGVLDAEKNELDHILSLTVENVLERRLQTILANNSTTKSVHQARVWIRHGHIQIGNQIVNIPSYLVRTSSEQHIRISEKSAYAK